MKDYYEILGIERNATEKDIKSAFYKLAHKYHPDKGGDEKKFKEINEAYQVLSDKEKRTQYDQFGRVFEGGGPGGAGTQGGPGFDFRGFDFGQGFGQGPGSGSGFGFEFGDLGEVFEEIFGGGGGFGARQKRDFKRGKDIQVDIEIPLEKILTEQEKEIVLDKYIVCSRCGGKGAEPGSKANECFSCRGTGQVQQMKRTFFGTVTQSVICPECNGQGFRPEKLCNVCRGEGRIKEREKIKMTIPAGVDTNQVLKVKGNGEAGKRGGVAGDLYLRLVVKEHSLFQRKGDDLYSDVSISFPQAALGDEIEIPTLEGKKILLKVPEGTESGKVFRISKKGIPHFGGFGRGDLYVELIIKTPKRLSRKQKELLEKLKEEGI